MTTPPSARNRALALLAIRDHSTAELARKLKSRGFEAQEVSAALEGLVADGLCSDANFAATYIKSRGARGFGPLRIRSELRQRGVDAPTIDQGFAEFDGDWADVARRAAAKKFGEQRPETRQERARYARFLTYRGFGADYIRQSERLIAHDSELDD